MHMCEVSLPSVQINHSLVLHCFLIIGSMTTSLAVQVDFILAFVQLSDIP